MKRKAKPEDSSKKSEESSFLGASRKLGSSASGTRNKDKDRHKEKENPDQNGHETSSLSLGTSDSQVLNSKQFVSSQKPLVHCFCPFPFFLLSLEALESTFIMNFHFLQCSGPGVKAIISTQQCGTIGFNFSHSSSLPILSIKFIPLYLACLKLKLLTEIGRN